MQGQKGGLGGPVGPVDRQRPSRGTAQIGQRITMGAPQGIIAIFADGIRATDQGATFPFQPLKPSPAGERQRFFGRVADLNDMSGDALEVRIL